jgi:hypothetical protein
LGSRWWYYGENLRSNGLRKVVKSWVKVGGQKLLKTGSKTAPGGTSGQLPEIDNVYPGVTASQIAQFRKLGGSWAEVPLGRKFR